MATKIDIMKRYIQILVFIAGALPGKSNNVSISNIQIVNHGPDSTYIQFDLSWENSWRVLNGPGNYDGVWVFFKFLNTYGGNYWNMLLLNDVTSTSDYLPPGLAYWRNNFGAMFFRGEGNEGTGTVSFTGIRLTLTPRTPFDVDVLGYAVEMVYIPGIADPLNSLLLHMGDGNGAIESPNAFHYGNTNFAAYSFFPLAVDTNAFDDDAIENPNTFFVQQDGLDSLGVPASNNNAFFPTGSPLWCMKYEITQGAYRDFLNTLFLQQQTTRTASSPTSVMGTGALTTSGNSRNFLEIRTPSSGGLPALYGCDANGNNVFDEADDGEYVACNYLSWPDVAAWLDWAGLSPMTEIHFERICRGISYPGNYAVYGEFAWGDSTINANALSLSNPFAYNEFCSNASSSVGNGVFMAGMTEGPLRNGIFATASSNRKTSGATYYGVMDMSGNLAESCVTVGNVAGRSFNKGASSGNINSAKGDGILSIEGNAQAYHWPGCTTAPYIETDFECDVVNGIGTILRGGSFASPKEQLRLADRSQGQVPDTREMHVGGRGVIVLNMHNF